MLPPDDRGVPRDRQEHVRDPYGLRHRHDPVAVHVRLEGPEGIHLGDHHLRAHPIRAHRQPAPAVPVPRHGDGSAGDEQIRRPDQAVERRLSRPVPVVEEMLGIGVVDGHDRVAQRAGAGHASQPDHPRRGFLGPSDHVPQHVRPLAVEDGHQVRAVVHRHGRVGIERLVDVPVVGRPIFSPAREHRQMNVLDQRGGDVVLRGERVAGAEGEGCAARLQRAHQVRRLGCDVEAGGDPQPGERTFAGKAFTNQPEHRHLPVGPEDALPPLRHELHILHVRLHNEPLSGDLSLTLPRP